MNFNLKLIQIQNAINVDMTFCKIEELAIPIRQQSERNPLIQKLIMDCFVTSPLAMN